MMYLLDYRGNAVVLPNTKQLAVFNLKNGLDIYSLLDFKRKCSAHYDLDLHTSQGIALFKSTLLACPTAKGNVNIYESHDATLVTTLYRPSMPFTPSL